MIRTLKNSPGVGILCMWTFDADYVASLDSARCHKLLQWVPCCPVQCKVTRLSNAYNIVTKN